MAGRIGQGLQQREQAAVGEIQQAGQKLQSDVDKEKQRQSGATTFGYPANQGVDAKTNVASTLQNLGEVGEEQTKTFQDLITGAGPNLQVAGAANLGQSVGQLKETARGLGTEQGRFEELRRNLGTGRGYSAGAQQLDQLLLQTQKNEASKLKELQKTVGVESGRQLEGLARTAETEASALGQQSKNIAEALRGGIGQAADKIKEDAAKEMESFKASDDYKTLKAGGYNDQQIYDYIREQMGTRNLHNIRGRLFGKEYLADKDTFLQADNLYGLDDAALKNLMKDDVNRMGEIDSYSGILSERGAGVLKNLGLLGGSAIPIQSASDLGFTDAASIGDIRKSALDKVMKGVMEKKDEYRKITADKDVATQKLVEAKDTAFQDIQKVTDIYNQYRNEMATNYKKSGNRYYKKSINRFGKEMWNPIGLNEYRAPYKQIEQQINSYMVPKYGQGYDVSWVAKGPEFLQQQYLRDAYNPALSGIQKDYATNTEKFTRKKAQS